MKILSKGTNISEQCSQKGRVDVAGRKVGGITKCKGLHKKRKGGTKEKKGTKDKKVRNDETKKVKKKAIHSTDKANTVDDQSKDCIANDTIKRKRKRSKDKHTKSKGKKEKSTRKKKRRTVEADFVTKSLSALLNIDVPECDSNGSQAARQIDEQIESEVAMRQTRDNMHVKETKEAATIILNECKDTLDRVKIIDVSQSPRLTSANCENFINNLVHSNRMIHHKLDQSRSMCEFAAEPVKRQWEESFLHEPVGDQHGCVKFKLGQCIATEMYSNIHGTDFSLREYFTPREMAEMHTNGNAAASGAASKSKKSGSKQICSEGTTCLLCRRHDVLSAILVARSKGDQIAQSLVLPNTANFVNVKGEYDLSNVVYNLPCRYEGLLDPVAAVNQRYFEPFMHNGIRWLRQTVPYAKGGDSGTLASTHF